MATDVIAFTRTFVMVDNVQKLTEYKQHADLINLIYFFLYKKRKV